MLALTSPRIIKVLNVFVASYPELSSTNQLSATGIKQEFQIGKNLYNTYSQELNLNTINISQFLYLAPADVLTSFSGLAQFFGLSSSILPINESQTLQLINNQSETQWTIQSLEDEEFRTISVKTLPDLKDNFRILPSSLLLEASNFVCPFKSSSLERKRNSVPTTLQDLYTELSNNLTNPSREGNMDLEELFEYYRKLVNYKAINNELPAGISEKMFRNLEFLSSFYAFYAYFDDDAILQLNAGYLLNTLFFEMEHENGYRIVSYGVHEADFVSLLKIFGIVGHQKVRLHNFESSEGTIEGMIYPKPGANLIIEVHLDEQFNLFMTVKYDNEYHAICKQSYSDRRCKIAQARAEFQKFRLLSTTAFKKQCKSDFTKQSAGTENAEVISIFRGIPYLLAAVILVFILYRGVLYVRRKYIDPSAPQKRALASFNDELELQKNDQS